MISWNEAQKLFPIGTLVIASVLRHESFGVFVSIPELEFEGLIRIIEFKDDEPMTFADYPEIGATVEAVIIDFFEASPNRKQVILSMKPSIIMAIKKRTLDL